MRKAILSILLAGSIFGTPVSAGGVDISALREGDMRRLVVHKDPVPVSEKEFDLEGFFGTATLADWRGKYVVLNIWASWCGPCRKEMPMLSILQAEKGGDHFEVLTIAQGYHEESKVHRFFSQIGVENLPKHQDTDNSLSRDMAIVGLPTTLIIDPDGFEIARLKGDADWSSESAKNIIDALVGSLPQD